VKQIYFTSLQNHNDMHLIKFHNQFEKRSRACIYKTTKSRLEKQLS